MLTTLVNVLVTVTLVAVMVRTGLEVSPRALVDATAHWGVVVLTVLVNYVAVPLVAVALLMAFHPPPMASAGILILAVCPGAPFAPQIAALARGDVALSVGLMGILSATSVVLAPLLLDLLLPWLVGGTSHGIAFGHVVSVLLLTQLLPLGLGVLVRALTPRVADRISKPLAPAMRALGLVTVVVVLFANRTTLGDLRLRGIAGMLLLWTASIAFGWLAGGSREGSRVAAAQTTSLRNVGVAMVIASQSFPNTSAAPAAVAYAAVSTFASVMLARSLARRSAARSGAPMRGPFAMGQRFRRGA